MNLIFDMDETIYDMTQPFSRAFETLWKDRYKVDMYALFLKSREYNDANYYRVLNKEMKLKDLGIYRISMAMKDFGYKISNQEALEFQQLYQKFQYEILLSFEIIQLFDFLKERNINRGILTNGITEHQMKKIHGMHLENWFDVKNIFPSESIGFSKPDIRAFECIEKKMNIKKESTWYVGDSFENDVVGSINAGWHCIYFDRRHKGIQDTNYQPDFIVHDEIELKKCICHLINRI